MTCSATHCLEMYQLLVEQYPDNLIAKDICEQIPLIYAIWCGAPSEVVEFLAKSYKVNYPEYVFDWENMVRHLLVHDAPLPRIQVLLDTRDRSFPDQKLDKTFLTIEFAQVFDGDKGVPIAKFQFLLRNSIAKRVESLNVMRWSVLLDERIEIIPFFPGKLDDKTRRFYALLQNIEHQKETASLLELALWKTALVDQQARIDEDTYRTQCRVNCGADVVIPNVQHFLGWSNDQAG